jgi:hypothetical protein
MEASGTGTRYVFTALQRDEGDFVKNKESGWQQLTEFAVDGRNWAQPSHQGNHASDLPIR